MIGYIDSSSFPVYPYGEMMISSPIPPEGKYYIWWTPSNISSGTFTMEGSTYNFSDYNGSFEFEGGIIQSSAFQNTLIQTLNTNAKEIEDYAFQSCTSLSWVSLPMCESIRDFVFWKCYSLSRVILPMCRYIGWFAFQSCPLTQVRLPMCSHITFGAFANCTSLSQVSLPMCSLLDEAAFQFCSSLSQVDLPMCISIDEAAFNACYSLTQVSSPVCTKLGKSAFWNCSSLSQVILPVCSHIQESAFYGCTSLNTITLGWSSICIFNSLVFNKTGITSSTGSIFVPSSLVSAYKSAYGYSYFRDRFYPINN